MSRRAPPVYRRGKYWLDWDARADGTLRSPYLAIFWYDTGTRRVRSSSTGTSAADEATLILDRRYLADADEAPAWCHACGQPLAKAEAYLLTDAIADYRLEWGDTRASADTIETRLNHVVDFLEAQDAAGERFGITTSCAVACTDAFVRAFRAWSLKQPVVWKNKAGKVTASKPRSPASTEASVAQAIAALNHAANADPPRADKRPAYRPLPASQVQRKRRTRVDVAEIGRMLAYAAEPGKRRGSLHAFLVASICTIARPGAVCDISIAPERGQWWRGSPVLDLNPQGRTQNKKHRALVPVVPLLSEWLTAELDDYEALPEDNRVGRGFLVNYYGRGVQDVDSAWNAMLVELKMPTGREWRPYVLRHSLARLVRNRGAELWDVQGFMGHHPGGQTEVYAVGDFPTVVTAIGSIITDLEKLAPGSLHRKRTGAASRNTAPGRKKMPG